MPRPRKLGLRAEPPFLLARGRRRARRMSLPDARPRGARRGALTCGRPPGYAATGIRAEARPERGRAFPESAQQDPTRRASNYYPYG